MTVRDALRAIAFLFFCGASARSQVIMVTHPPMPLKQDGLRAAMTIGAAPDAASAKRGRQLFATACAFCHGANATGGNSGPNLVRSVHDSPGRTTT